MGSSRPGPQAPRTLRSTPRLCSPLRPAGQPGPTPPVDPGLRREDGPAPEAAAELLVPGAHTQHTAAPSLDEPTAHHSQGPAHRALCQPLGVHQAAAPPGSSSEPLQLLQSCPALPLLQEPVHLLILPRRLAPRLPRRPRPASSDHEGSPSARRPRAAQWVPSGPWSRPQKGGSVSSCAWGGRALSREGAKRVLLT